MNRGARHQVVFHNDEDCGEFIGLVDRYAARFHIEVHAFALMPNHFHLLVVSNGGRLSDFAAQLLGGYARYKNARPGWDGPIWQGRFKSCLITEDAYWLHLVAYIHLNPVRAGLVDGPTFARWTSLDTYLHGDSTLTCLRTDQVLEAYGGVEPMMDYMDDVQHKRRDAPTGLDETRLWHVPASQPVPTQVERELPAFDVEEAIEQVCRVTGVDRSELFRYRRGSANRAAWIAAWWLQEGVGITQREIAPIMGLSQTGVAQRNRHLRKHVNTDQQLQEWMGALRDSRQEPGRSDNA